MGEMPIPIITAAAVIIKTGTKIHYEAPFRGFLILYSLNLSLMERFKKEIIVDNEPRAFEFSRLKNMSGIKFFITSTDADRKPIAFSLKETDAGDWRLVPGSLRWLYEIETQLSNAIREKQMDSHAL